MEKTAVIFANNSGQLILPSTTILIINWTLAKIEFQSRCGGGPQTAPTEEKYKNDSVR